MSNLDSLEAFNSAQKTLSDRRKFVEEIEDSFSVLDSTFNFKVNKVLKDEFEKVCKKSLSNPSRELKLFMLRTIKSGRI